MEDESPGGLCNLRQNKEPRHAQPDKVTRRAAVLWTRVQSEQLTAQSNAGRTNKCAKPPSEGVPRHGTNTPCTRPETLKAGRAILQLMNRIAHEPRPVEIAQGAIDQESHDLKSELYDDEQESG